MFQRAWLSKRGLTALLALAAAAGVLTASSALPLARDAKPVVRMERATATAELREGTRLTVDFHAPGGEAAGLVLFARDDAWDGRRLRARLADAHGVIRAESTRVRAGYERGALRIALPFRRITLARGEALTLTVELLRGQPLRLFRLPDGGTLALSLERPVRLPEGTRLGVRAGVIALVGLAGVTLLPRRRGQWLGVAALLVLLTPLALAGFWYSSGSWGISDWDYYFSLHESYRTSILTFHSFPFWNPMTCGGTAGLADPEFPGFTFTFLLELLFGVPMGLKLSIYAAVVVGALGMLALARRLGAFPQAAFVAALAASFGTVNLLEIVEGHVNIFSAMWLPWIFWAWYRAYRREGKALVCGVFLALTFFQGGIYLLSYTALAFLLLMILVARPIRALRVTVMAGLWALGLAAVKLVPVLFWLREFPDATYASSPNTFPWLWEILLGRHLHGAVVLSHQEGGWHEYGAYVGPIVLGLALLGATRARRRVVRGLVVGAVLALLLSTAGPLLKPVFDVVPYIPRSNISRVILFAVLPLSLLAGVGLDSLRIFRRHAAVSVLIAGAVAVDLASLAYPLAEQAFVLEAIRSPLPPAPWPIAFTLRTYPQEVAGEQHSRTYATALAGYGTTAYCSVLGPPPLVKTIHDEGDTSFVTTESGNGRVTLVSWSPNVVRVRATIPEPTKLIINTNYARGWTANGLPAESVGGRVGTAVGSGEHDVRFAYRPVGFPVGLAVSLVTFAGAVFSVLFSGTARRSLLRRPG